MTAAADSPFAILGVRPDAPEADIKAAWLSRVQESHPDRLADAPPEAVEAALERTKRLNAAYAEVKRRRAAGEGPAARGRVPGVRPPRAVQEPRTAADALQRAERAIEDAGAALEACERSLRLIRNGLRLIGSDLAEHEQRAAEATAQAKAAVALAEALPVAVREAAARALAGDALRLVAQARALPAGHRNERRTLLVRAEAGATAGLSKLGEARRAAESALGDAAAEITRQGARVGPVARALAARWAKADEAARRYRSQLAGLPAAMEPARAAGERAVVAAARAQGLVLAEAASAPPEVAAHWRRRAAGLERAAGDLAPRTPPELPAPPGSPYALPAPEVVQAAAGRLRAACEAAAEAARRVEQAAGVVTRLRAGGADAFVASALAFVDTELASLRGAVADRA